jgi:hypothetical protein
MTPNLTAGYSADLEEKIRQTWSGMAHWAGTGPIWATCGKCKYFGYHRYKQNRRGETVASGIRPNACRRFFELTNAHGPSFPKNTPSCRHFVEAV